MCVLRFKTFFLFLLGRGEGGAEDLSPLEWFGMYLKACT